MDFVIFTAYKGPNTERERDGNEQRGPPGLVGWLAVQVVGAAQVAHRVARPLRLAAARRGDQLQREPAARAHEHRRADPAAVAAADAVELARGADRHAAAAAHAAHVVRPVAGGRGAVREGRQRRRADSSRARVRRGVGRRAQVRELGLD